MVILSLLKDNKNLKHVTGIYAMLTCLTSYLYEPEHHMSQLMKKRSKETDNKNVKEKMWCIGISFLNQQEVSMHETIQRVLSVPMRHSNNDVIFLQA